MISMLWKRESPTIRDHYETLGLVKKREVSLKMSRSPALVPGTCNVEKHFSLIILL